MNYDLTSEPLYYKPQNLYITYCQTTPLHSNPVTPTFV
jgi:hypothetical protein